MNLAVLCFHALGGSGVVAGELGRALALRGHRVHFVGAALPGRLANPPAGVFLHAAPLEEPAPVGSQAFALTLAALLAEVITAQQIELIHAHYAIPHAAAAALARQALGPSAPPLVLSLHGSDVPADSASPGRVLLVRSLLSGASAVTTPSVALAVRARERLSLPASFPLEAIPNFVDTAHFSPGPDRSALARLFPERDLRGLPVLCHASNFRPVKRPLDLVRVFARVRARRPALLVLAGDGPERASVVEEVRALSLDRDVAFAGATRDLAPILRACDLFLLPSASESFGLAALEAMSCGVPVLATNAGGLPEVVKQGEAGLLFEVGDVDAMAAAALRLLDDDAELARLSRGARARAVALFETGPVVSRWESLYRRVLRDGPRR